jgi:23S rRNA (uracil1939-C5)-methyltransferase
MDETFELDLTAMAHGGAALGRHEGRAIFVPSGLPGERVRARIREDKGRFAYADLLEVLQASPARIAPRCPHFGIGQCGGCHWQHIEIASQLEYKRLIVADQLERLGKIEKPQVLPTLASPAAWDYRNHILFNVTPAGELGFFADDNATVIPISECHIMQPELLELFDHLDLDTHSITRLRLQVGSDPADRMLVIETEDDQAPEIEIDVPVSVNFLTRDNEPANLIGSAQVTYQIRGRAFRVTAGGFFQANTPMAEMLVDEVMARLGLQGGESVLELYSGVGMLTAFIAEKAGLVTSVESYPPAVNDADANLADFENIDLLEGSVEDVLPELEEQFDALVVDPPRAGLSEEVVKRLVRMNIPKIVYVSCDPATFARDAGQFFKLGYELSAVQPIDMFPQTYHIECVALLER